MSRDNSKTVWRANNNHDKEKIPNEDLDVPIRSPEKSKRYRIPNRYIEFNPTGVQQDIAQTTGNSHLNCILYCVTTYFNCSCIITVPFIDTQPVEAKIPKPLIGGKINNVHLFSH